MKKLFSSLLVALTILSFLFLYIEGASAQTVPPSSAPQSQNYNYQQQTESQNQLPNPQSLPYNTNPDVPKNLSTYTQSVFIELLGTASCFLNGQNLVHPDQRCLGIDPQTKKIGYVDSSQGLTGAMSGMIAYTFTIPVSSSHYTRYIASNFGISQKALAQETGFATGTGFEQLTPVLPLWTTMRNLTYLLFVLIFVVLGLGIMFRMQIDPRAVMTIQSQLPKVVIALILITFSYAIAGFFVDMMYVSFYLIIDIFSTHGLDTSAGLATSPLQAAGGVGGIGGVAFDASKGITGVLSNLFDGNIFGETIKGVLNGVYGMIAGAAGGAMLGGPIGAAIGAVAVGSIAGIGSFFGIGIPGIPDGFTVIVGGIAWLVIVIAVLSALFRLWFTLIKTYIFILINVIFAPVFIVFGLFPGSSLSFGSWLRSIISNLAAFPTVLMLFSLGKTIQDGFKETGHGGFVPPYVGDPGDMNVFAGIIGLGVILLAPEAVNIVKSALKAPDFKYGPSIGRSIGAGTGLISKPVGGVWGSVTGEDARGNPRPLTKFAKDIGGRGAAAIFGGSLGREGDSDNSPLIKNPVTGIREKLRNRRNKKRRDGGGTSGPATPVTPPGGSGSTGGGSAAPPPRESHTEHAENSNGNSSENNSDIHNTNTTPPANAPLSSTIDTKSTEEETSRTEGTPPHAPNISTETSGHQREGGLTQEAKDLIKDVDERNGVPAFVSNNLKRIARENGINVTDNMTPNDVIDALRAKG